MKKIIKICLIIILIGCLYTFFVNLIVVLSTKKQINTSHAEAILVLGAGVWNGEPSPMLRDRLDEAIILYYEHKAPKIIMSGDHGKDEYDEVNVMKEYAIKNGVPSEDIFMDHAGFSTYDSIYRAKEIFETKNIIIVTQKYHLYRSLYIANNLNINATGVEANHRRYTGATFRKVREFLARNKDFLKCIIKPKPKYLGDVIPVSGNGDVTNDKID